MRRLAAPAESLPGYFAGVCGHWLKVFFVGVSVASSTKGAHYAEGISRYLTRHRKLLVNFHVSNNDRAIHGWHQTGTKPITFGFSLNRHDIDVDFQRCVSPADNHASHRADVAIIASDTNWNMIGAAKARVGRIAVDPSQFLAAVDA